MLGESKKVVAVLRGGTSPAHGLSLKTGRKAKKVLESDFAVRDILIDKQGNWYVNGVQEDPRIALEGVETIWNALHGKYGEDGKVQQFFESLGKKYTGTKPVGSAVSMNKKLSKKIFSDFGIKVPLWKTLKLKTEKIKDDALNLFKTFVMPAIVKPISSGSSNLVFYCDNYNSLVSALESLLEAGEEEAIVEEFINGKEVSVGTIRGFRNQPMYTMLPVEIHKRSPIYGYEFKEIGGAEFISPAGLTLSEKEAVERAAKISHEALGLGHYSKIDVIVHPRRGVYVLEMNSLPDIWDESAFLHSFTSLSITPEEFYAHVISLAENTR